MQDLFQTQNERITNVFTNTQKIEELEEFKHSEIIAHAIHFFFNSDVNGRTWYFVKYLIFNANHFDNELVGNIMNEYLESHQELVPKLKTFIGTDVTSAAHSVMLRRYLELKKYNLKTMVKVAHKRMAWSDVRMLIDKCVPYLLAYDASSACNQAAEDAKTAIIVIDMLASFNSKIYKFLGHLVPQFLENLLRLTSERVDYWKRLLQDHYTIKADKSVRYEALPLLQQILDGEEQNLLNDKLFQLSIEKLTSSVQDPIAKEAAIASMRCLDSSYVKANSSKVTEVLLSIISQHEEEVFDQQLIKYSAIETLTRLLGDLEPNPVILNTLCKAIERPCPKMLVYETCNAIRRLARTIDINNEEVKSNMFLAVERITAQIRGRTTLGRLFDVIATIFSYMLKRCTDSHLLIPRIVVALKQVFNIAKQLDHELHLVPRMTAEMAKDDFIPLYPHFLKEYIIPLFFEFAKARDDNETVACLMMKIADCVQVLDEKEEYLSQPLLMAVLSYIDPDEVLLEALMLLKLFVIHLRDPARTPMWMNMYFPVVLMSLRRVLDGADSQVRFLHSYQAALEVFAAYLRRPPATFNDEMILPHEEYIMEVASDFAKRGCNTKHMLYALGYIFDLPGWHIYDIAPDFFNVCMVNTGYIPQDVAPGIIKLISNNLNEYFFIDKVCFTDFVQQDADDAYEGTFCYNDEDEYEDEEDMELRVAEVRKRQAIRVVKACELIDRMKYWELPSTKREEAVWLILYFKDRMPLRTWQDLTEKTSKNFTRHLPRVPLFKPIPKHNTDLIVLFG